MVISYSKLLLIILLGLSAVNPFKVASPGYISTSEIERCLFIFGSFCCGIMSLTVGKPFCGVGTCCLAMDCYACVAPVIGEKVANIIDQ